MKINVVKNESKELIIEFDDGDLTLPEFLAGELSKEEDVAFAGVDRQHLGAGKPKLIVRTERKKAIDMLDKALDAMDEEFSGLKSQLSKKK
ncbi:MAG: RpoL/Rpb11 RNA polymerase subunit family protein [Candidatus Micrarchaeia archaeon]